MAWDYIIISDIGVTKTRIFTDTKQYNMQKLRPIKVLKVLKAINIKYIR